MLVVALAILVSLWATYVTMVHLRMGGMIFIDMLLPKESSKAFIQEIPEEVRNDVVTGHLRGLRIVVFPLITTAVLWLGAYIITEWQRRHGE